MSEKKFRLPDWLGGHELAYCDEIPDSPNARIGIEPPTDEDPGRVIPMTVPRQWLVEVKPPSIDDPVEWPMCEWDSETDRKIWLGEDDTGAALEPRAAKLAISLRKEHLSTNDGSVFEYVIAEAPMTVEDLRDLARTAWQRANAVEAGES